MALQTVSSSSGICGGISGILIAVLRSVLSLCRFAVSRTRLPLPLYCSFHLYKTGFCSLVLNAGTYFVKWRENVMAICCLCVASTVLFLLLFFFVSETMRKRKKIHFKSTLIWRWSLVSSVAHTVNRFLSLCTFCNLYIAISAELPEREMYFQPFSRQCF